MIRNIMHQIYATTHLDLHSSVQSRRWAILGFISIPVIYALVWGSGTIEAIRVLLGSPIETHLRTSDVPAVFTWMLVDCAVVFYCLLMLRQIAGSFEAIGLVANKKAALLRHIKAFFVGASAIFAGFAAVGLLAVAIGAAAPGAPRYVAETGLGEALLIANSLLAGPTEELALMALLVVTCQVLKFPLWIVLSFAVLLRVPFHLYYGWGALALAVWPVLIVLLYRYSGALLGIILAHSFWNLSSEFGEAAGPVRATLVGAGLVIVVITISRLRAARIKSRDAESR